MPALKGAYLFADFVHGKMWILPDPYGEKTDSIELFDTNFFIVSFAEDSHGEIYFLNFSGDGEIFRLVSTHNVTSDN